MDCPAGLKRRSSRSNSSKPPPNPGGRSLVTEHTDPCKTCYYLWVIQRCNRSNRLSNMFAGSSPKAYPIVVSLFRVAAPQPMVKAGEAGILEP